MLASGKKVDQATILYEEKYVPEDQFRIIFDIIYHFMSQENIEDVPRPSKVKSRNPKDSVGTEMA